MATDRTASPHQAEEDQLDDDDAMNSGPDTAAIPVTRLRVVQDGQSSRNRSPTPPRALFRSTTGKGVAFTEEDVSFLVRFMEYRK